MYLLAAVAEQAHSCKATQLFVFISAVCILHMGRLSRGMATKGYHWARVTTDLYLRYIYKSKMSYKLPFCRMLHFTPYVREGHLPCWAGRMTHSGHMKKKYRQNQPDA